MDGVSTDVGADSVVTDQGTGGEEPRVVVIEYVVPILAPVFPYNWITSPGLTMSVEPLEGTSWRLPPLMEACTTDRDGVPGV
jgi:hypothetical protein